MASTEHESLVEAAKAAIDKVANDTSVELEDTVKSLIDIREHVLICIEAADL